MSIGIDPAETFRQEARELLDALEQSLLDLEQTPDSHDLVDASFRALHTLKGSGSMFGFDEVADFVHEFETAFDKVRKGRSAISTGLVTVALAARDHIQKLIEQPGQHAPAGRPILEALRKIVDTDGAPAPEPAVAAVADASATAGKTWRIVFRLPDDALAFGTNPLLLLDELRELGPCRVTALTDRIPMLETMEPTLAYLGWEVILETDGGLEKIEDVFMFIRDGMELSIEPGAGTVAGGADVARTPDAVSEPVATTKESSSAAPAVRGAKVKAKDATAAASSADRGGSSMRVAAERLDELMDRVGELVIAQSRLTQIASASNDLNLKNVAEELERLASGLRDTTMGIRMVPIGSLFGRFRRLVHDLSHDLGKEIEFVTTGEETELDKTMIERLADPLVHLIRNSIDHGIESPDKRLAAGKGERGRVKLSATHSGAEVAISISDDGKGLDAQRIRAKAEEAGLIAPDAKIADAELYQMIFHPGFSTAGEITSVSGRGVGMDVVKRTIEGLRGSIDLSTRHGEGTTATLRLPLTLAIIEGMLVRVGNGRYSIPLSAVEECVELPPAADLGDQGRNFLNIRGSLVPFLRLRELFKTTTPPDPYQKVVIVAAGDARVGLVVDQIIGNSQTVIKSLSKLHADVETFSGATILGDGTVALILDVMNLVSFGQKLEGRLRSEHLRRAA
ncbi:chemotaxis protein CheA [Aquibium sp. ELW1220]|uniref:chemotaxis protein CheA n=1 Tax=Aquibium sp. ELW1220 TaxID=2976766 RepID=UPI0025B0D8FE|nr:chemotaxis protein CheA [Aquibium sp. ELW1220]MDN2581691.1 chemotaxis protein CheA [Aquibium sp. ELW1220]